MHLPGFLASRDDLPTSTSGIHQARCKSFLTQVKWCPIDVALWTLLIAIISFICWFVYSAKRGGRSTRSNSKLYRRLSLPYPASGSLEFAQYSGYDYDVKKDSVNSSATLIDPYHVVDKLDGSLIAQDISFNGTSLPQPTLEQKKTGKLASGLGLGIIMDNGSPRSADSSEKSPHENEKTTMPPPEQAHLRQAWWNS